MDNDIRDHRSQITDEDHLYMATQNRLMRAMLLEIHGQWEAEQRLQHQMFAAERDRMAAKCDHWAGKLTERA